MTDTRNCPHCNGEIKAAAKICKHCKQPLESATAQAPAAPPTLAPAASAPAPAPTPPPPLSQEDQGIKRLIISRGLLTAAQFDQTVQGRAGDDADVLAFLAAKGMMTPSQVDAVRIALKAEEDQRRGVVALQNLSPEEQSIRKVLLAKGLVTDAQIKEALGVADQGGDDLLTILQRKGTLTVTQVESVRAAYREQLATESKRIGEVAVQKMMITQEQLDQALEVQKTSDKAVKLGDLLVEQGFITEAQKEVLLQGQGISLGALKDAVGSKVLKEKAAKFKGLPKKTKVMIGGVAGLAIVVALLTCLLSGSPEIKPNCVTNGLGNGSCSFTNKGSAGAMCGRLHGWCRSGGYSISETICSGEVQKNETKKVTFDFVKFGRMVLKNKAPGDWDDSCSFKWVVEE